MHLFVAPRKVLLGEGSSAEIGRLLVELGVPAGTVLVVADRIVAQLSLTALLDGPLQAAGYATEVYGEIAGEPDLDAAERVVRQVRSAAYVAVIGLGGGSSLDLAKLAALLATNAGSVGDYVRAAQAVNRPLPLVLVPTTAGTGSEATRAAVLTVDGNKRAVFSEHFVPLAAILDPALITSLPPAVTASTGLDALCHAAEAYVSLNENALSAAPALHAAALLARWLPRAHTDGANLEARRATLYAAYLAGLSLNAGAVLGHSMGYTIARRTHLPHGVTCAMALPFCLAYSAAAAGSKLAELGRATSGREGATAASFLTYLMELNASLGLPARGSEVGLKRADMAPMAEEVLALYPRPNNPAPLEPGRLTRLYELFLDGNLEAALALP